MRILHIGEYVKGGVATYLRELIEYQTKQNCEVFLCVSDYISEINFSLDSKNIIRYSYKRSPQYFLFASYFIWKTIRRIEPDIVHIHSTFAGIFTRTALFILPLNRMPKIIYCAHGWSFIMEVPYWKKKFYSIIERILAYKTDLIINISKYEQEQSNIFGIPQTKSFLIYNGLNEISNNEILDNNLVKLLFVGRFDHQKGVDILLELFEKESFPHIELLLAGDTVINNKKIIIPSNVKYLGWLDTKNLEKYYKLCDAVIMPSRWEGFGLVALEAMRNKKAVIASNVAALPEIIVNEITGILFELNKPEELCSILHSLDKRKLAVMGEAGYKHYKENFTADIMNFNIFEKYEQLLKIQ